MFNPWLDLTFRTMRLGWDAQNVVALRMLRMASGGPRARAELNRMVAEKVAAGAEADLAATTAVIAGSEDHVVAGKVLRVFKKRVRANKRRLTR
ncbi:MAG TPA: hypothetical protein VMV19_13565 [Xanthobacteraceae bacterium]|nr:hypothetical protein [Xanthobacteraceae bacterium]